MRIARLVRLRMVNAVRADPEHRAAFERHGPANREGIGEPLRALIGLMRMQPVIPKADAEPDADPMQRERGKERLPTEKEERRKRAGMEKNKKKSGRPVDAPAVWERNDMLAQTL